MSEQPTEYAAGDPEVPTTADDQSGHESSKATTGKGWRMTVAFILVALFAVALYAANHAVWFATTVLSTDQFVDTLAPLPGDPAVANALGAQFATSVVEDNDVAGTIAEFLPDGISFISIPVAEAIKGVIADVATQIIGSDVFTQVWERSLRFTHSAVIVVLDGGPRGNLAAVDGTVVLDLSGLVSEVDARLSDLGIDVLDTEEITAQIVIFDGSKLGLAQWIAELIYAVRWVAPIAVLILLGAALAVATDRRRIGWWLGVATAITMALTLIELRLVESTVISSIVDPIAAEGVQATWHILIDRFVAQTWALLALGLVAAAVIWAFGPSRRAAAMRSTFDRRQPATADGGVFGFIGSHARTVQWSAVAVGVAFLLLTPTVSGLLVIVTAIVVGVVVTGSAWLAGSADAGAVDES